MKAEIREKVVAMVLLALSFWVLLYRLDAVPLKLWDESRQANNALEMLLSGNWWYPTYDGAPDFWNTKPHLLVVLQALCMKWLGPGLLALRLPSALAGCITLLLWHRFISGRFGYTAAGVWLLVMVTCGGFNVYHVTRTGDYDALLTLMISLVNMEFFRMVLDRATWQGWLRAGTWLALAVLTKSLAALIWLPAWLLLWLISGLYRKTTLRMLAAGASVPIIAVAVYYGLREYMTPGYLQAVADHEIMGRYFSPNEGHRAPWWYYADVLWNDYFRWFILAIPAALFIPGNRPVRRPLVFALLMSLVFVVVLSLSETRIWWYLAPVIPLLAFSVCLAFADRVKSGVWGILLLLGLLVAAIPGYYRNYNGNTTSHGVRPELVLQEVEKTGVMPFKSATWQVAGYHPVETYYRRLLGLRGIPLKLNKDFDSHLPGDTLVVSHMEFLDSLGRRYHMRQHRYPDDQMPVWVMVVDSFRVQKN